METINHAGTLSVCDAASPPPLSALTVLQLDDDSRRTLGLVKGAKQMTVGKKKKTLYRERIMSAVGPNLVQSAWAGWG